MTEDTGNEKLTWESLDAESAERIETSRMLARKFMEHPKPTQEEYIEGMYSLFEDFLNILEGEGENVVISKNPNCIMGKSWILEKVESTGAWLMKKTYL